MIKCLAEYGESLEDVRAGYEADGKYEFVQELTERIEQINRLLIGSHVDIIHVMLEQCPKDRIHEVQPILTQCMHES
jgi:hypothetical protein